MLEELLKHDKLGNKIELSFVLFKALSTDEEQGLDDLKNFCITNVFSISRSFYGIICLFKFLSFIKIENEKITLCQNIFNKNDFFQYHNYFEKDHFYRCLFNKLIELNAIHDLFNENNLKFSKKTNQYYVKENLIPFYFFPIRSLLLSLDFLIRDTFLNNHLLINEKFTGLFKSIIIDKLSNYKNQKRKISLGEFKKRIAQKEEVGKIAELFVLKYEKNRLLGHPNKEKIKRISEKYVNAGYDIESFNDIDSFINDRFIEVKSYQDEISFFWSKNEVTKANKLKKKYYLYLVDRALMNEKNYIPKIFQDPYRKIFENDVWKKEIENWKVTIEN